MPKLKNLSGKQLISILSQFGFSICSQKGSHVKVRRITPSGAKQALTIPQHKELDTGTLKAIYRQACRFISEDELVSYFYL